MGAAGACSRAGGGDGSVAVAGGCLVVMLGIAGEPPSHAHAALGANPLGGGAGEGLAVSPPRFGKLCGASLPRCAHNRGPPQAPFLPQRLWKLCVGACALARRQGRGMQKICLNLPQ